MEIQILCITKIALWGRPPPTRFYVGETYGGDRPQRGSIERLLRGYLAIYNTIMMSQKETRFFLKVENYNLSTSFCFFKNFKSFLEITK
jgi:hypothetical protein